MKYNIDFKYRDGNNNKLTDEVLYSQEINFKKNHLEIRFLYHIGMYREHENFYVIKKDSIINLNNPLTQWRVLSTKKDDDQLDKASVCNIEIKYKLDSDSYDLDIKFNIEDRKYRDKLFKKIKDWITKETK